MLAQTAQSTVSLLHCEGTSLTLSCPLFTSSLRTSFPSSQLLSHATVRAIASWLQDFAFPFLELHEVFISCCLLPVRIPLSRNPFLQCLNCSFKCTVSMSDTALYPTVQLVRKNAKQYQTLRNSAPAWAPGFTADHHHKPLAPAVQPVPNSPYYPHVQTVSQ